MKRPRPHDYPFDYAVYNPTDCEPVRCDNYFDAENSLPPSFICVDEHWVDNLGMHELGVAGDLVRIGTIKRFIEPTMLKNLSGDKRERKLNEKAAIIVRLRSAYEQAMSRYNRIELGIEEKNERSRCEQTVRKWKNWLDYQIKPKHDADSFSLYDCALTGKEEIFIDVSCYPPYAELACSLWPEDQELDMDKFFDTPMSARQIFNASEYLPTCYRLNFLPIGEKEGITVVGISATLFLDSSRAAVQTIIPDLALKARCLGDVLLTANWERHGGEPWVDYAP